ncbi:MAG TPA: hypothetical protein VNO52_14625, partial [Methylomirabilota bacterium]|nr:hypothetical protein [Methylomirabilota bacterium]
MFRHRLFRTFAGLCVLLGAAFSGYTQIVIDGAADRSIHTDSASFRVQAIAGTTTTATLNGQPIAGGVFHTITRMDHYELAVRQVRDADGAVSTATRQFIVRSSQRGSPETGLIAWTPYPQIDSTAAEFSGATLHLVTPTAFPAGLPIPVVAWVAEGQDRVRRANGWITAPGFEANPIRLLRGWGSGLLPAADGGGSLEFQARLHDLQNAKTIPIEAGTAWTPVSGVLNGAVNWPPDSRIHITGHVGIPANASLTIGAGTVVKLNPLATITNLGRVVINGTLDRPVVLTATNPVAPHQHTHAWGG